MMLSVKLRSANQFAVYDAHRANSYKTFRCVCVVYASHVPLCHCHGLYPSLPLFVAVTVVGDCLCLCRSPGLSLAISRFISNWCQRDAVASPMWCDVRTKDLHQVVLSPIKSHTDVDYLLSSGSIDEMSCLHKQNVQEYIYSKRCYNWRKKWKYVPISIDSLAARMIDSLASSSIDHSTSNSLNRLVELL